MKHQLLYSLVKHLDGALKAFNGDVNSLLETHSKNPDSWGLYSELNKLDLLTLASYYIEGYEPIMPEYIKSLQEVVSHHPLGGLIHSTYSAHKFKEDPVLYDLWNKAENSINDVADYLKNKYGLEIY